MKYRDIKPAVCSCCFPNLLEDAAPHGLQFNRQIFYNNMQQLIDSGTASDLEGVDTVVRLGYLEKVDSETIFGNFELEHPIAGARNRGSYNSAEDRLRLAYDMVFEPGSIGSGTSTLAHELRHRAFYIISVTPELEALMPEELRDRWADGYGRSSYSVDRWRYEGAFASPEHAMIYAVQYRDPMNEKSRARFFDNPALEGRSAEYWRSLYRSVEQAVRGWFRDRVPQLSNDQTTAEMLPPFELTAQQQAFYRSLSSIHGLRRESLSLLLQEMWGRFAAVSISNSGEIREITEAAATAIFERDFERMPALLQRYQQMAPAITNNADAVRLQTLLGEFERTGIPWRLLDIDTFDSAEFAALVQLRPELVPAVPVVRAAPASTNTRGSAQAQPDPGIVVPTGNRIGLYQWAVSNSLAGTNLWDLITGSVSTNTLQQNMQGMFAVQIERAGLEFSPEAQNQLQALYTMLAAGGYDRTVVNQMLARIELVKR